MTKTVSEYLTFRAGQWINQSFIEASDMTKFNDIKFYYANIIDYSRIIMCVIAAYTITTDWYLLSAFLVLGATLLDWIDGPVARAYDQCSLLGCGLDWTADLLSQMVMITWWAHYDFSVVPWLLIATFIEIGTGIFDYATTAKLKYPILKENQGGFFLILDWSMPLNSYTQFGNFLWYSYPTYCVLRTLECCYGYDGLLTQMDFLAATNERDLPAIIFLLNRYCLFIPSVLYIWCEAAYGIHILRSWTEPTRRRRAASEEILYDDTLESYQGGFIHYKPLVNEYQNVLKTCYDDLQVEVQAAYEKAVSNSEVFWINLWKRTGNTTEKIALREGEKLDQLVHDLVHKYYEPDSVLLDGYGYIINPIHSRSQPFHIDYTMDYSSLFIPLVPITVDNACQYLVLSSSTDLNVLEEATRDLDQIDVSLLLKNSNSCSIRQCLANPFTVLQMDFGTIHRGIANQGTYHRPMFYISVIRKDQVHQTEIPDEPLIKTIKNDFE